MSPSSRLRAWMAILAAASLAGCSGVVTDNGNANGDGEAALAPVGPGALLEEVVQGSGDGQDSACGDGTCDPAEACDSCPADCGACPPGCGDGVCDPSESCSSCSADCGACSCAHATCTVGVPLDEACDPCVAQICAVDSFCCEHQWDAICVSEVASVCGTPCPATCGDGQCTAGEACDTCAQDCGACPVCGNGLCDWTEACDTCSQDCGACPVCGDGLCDWTENCQSCAGDCGACPTCGDGTCDWGESCGNCAGDCGACVCHDTCQTGTPLDASCGTCEAQICAVDSFCCTAMWDALCVSEVGSICGTPCAASCGDGQCSAGETCQSCAQDCGACSVCGDAVCDWTESCQTCAQDCGACPVCGDGVCDWTEACDTCAQDCGACAACGDGVCQQGETCSTCAGDCGACPACPSDTLSGPLPQTVTGTTGGLVNGLPTTCASSNAPEVTYSFTAPADGAYEFNTFGSAYDTILVVRDGDCQGAGLACNDDTAGLRSKVSVDLTAGQTVIIQVDGFATQSGVFTLTACQGACAPACGDGACDASESCSSCAQDCGACPTCGDGFCQQGESCASCSSDCGACSVCGDAVCDPTEGCDTCAGDCGACPACPAVDLGSAVPQTVTGSTTGLVNAIPSPCASSSSGEMTYSFTAPADGTYEFNTAGSAFDTILHAHDGTCQGASLACNDDNAGLQSRLLVPLTAGQTVIVVVEGFGNQSGAFTLNVL